MKISAIIPVYNGKKHLREAVNSVISQTLQPIELILVDDGSTDGSLLEIEGVTANFPIRIIKQKNAGQASARNHGIKESKGDFIALLDQDDIWHSQHLEKLAEFFKGNLDLGWTYSNLDETDEKGRVFRSGILDFCAFQHPQNQLVEMIRYDMYILPSASLIRKVAILEVGMFDERLSGYEDDDLFLRLFVKGWKQKYIADSLSQWRMHSNNSGRSPRGHQSRRIYAQKIIDEFSSSNLFTDFSPAEIIGVRFFNTVCFYYGEALKVNDFSKCKWLMEDLVRYYKLTPKSFQRNMKLRILLRKFPRLFKFGSRTKQFLRGL